MNSEPIEFTTEDRRMIRDMHDALVGTVDRKGWLRVVEDHIERHEDVTTAAEAAIAEHVVREPHITDRRDGHGWSWRRLGYDVMRSVGTGIVLIALGWMVVGAYFSLMANVPPK